MKIQYLEIVTPKVDELAQQYSAIHGISFGPPEPSLGQARTAPLNDDGGRIGIRPPMRTDEAPVIRPYTLVPYLKKAVEAARQAGAEIAIDSMDLPGQKAKIAIVIQGGIESGLWQQLES